VIKSIEQKKESFEKGGWNISIPGVLGGKPKVVNIRHMVYEIMDVAIQFKDIVDKVMALDATNYGNVIRGYLPVWKDTNTPRSGAVAWSVVSLGLSVSTNSS
jgi:hypothetical protein